MVGSLIKLFPSSSLIFNNNGLGSLNDCLSCFVEEERNGQYELTMTYPVTGRRFSDITNRSIIFCKPNPFSRPQAFRIYSITKPINGQIEINACHISYDMKGYPVAPFEAISIGEVFNGVDSVLIENCPVKDSVPFIFWTDKVTQGAMKMDKPYPMRTILGGVKGSVLDIYGGEYEFDNFTVRLWAHRGENNGVTIRYGKNLTDFNQEENCSDTYTAVYPYWWSDDNTTDNDIADEGDESETTTKLVELPEKIVQITDVEGNEGIIYDHVKVLVLDTSEHFKEEPTIEQMREYTKSYIKTNDVGLPKVSIDLSFVTLEKIKEYETIQLLEAIKLCDTVNIYFPKMNVVATAKCIKTKYDVLKDRYDSISLGSPKNEVSDTIAETITNAKEAYDITRSAYGQAVIDATRAITGHSGGYVIFNPSNNPREILVCDQLDYTSPTCKVWRWNVNGLGFSENGYNGEYKYFAVTSEGALNASVITTGLLNGAIIDAGTVSASAISQEYTQRIMSEIDNSATMITQNFQAANGVMLNNIKAIEDNTQNALNTITEKQSSLEQTVDGLSLSFSKQETGGVNKIRNSVGMNGVSSDWNTEGIVYSIQNDDETLKDTVSGSEWSLYSGSSMSQIIPVNSKKNYILSLKFKSKTTSLGKVKIFNGQDEVVIVESIEVNESWTEVSYPFVAASRSVELVIESSGDGFYISDLLLIEGTIPRTWMPADGEVYGENVKIDIHGINITNPEAETQTRIDHRQFAVLDSDGNQLLSVNPTYTFLLRTEIKHELDVGKLRIMPTDYGAELMIKDQEVEG